MYLYDKYRIFDTICNTVAITGLLRQKIILVINMLIMF